MTQKWQHDLFYTVNENAEKPIVRTASAHDDAEKPKVHTASAYVTSVNGWRAFAQDHSKEPLPPVGHILSMNESHEKANMIKASRGNAGGGAKKENFPDSKSKHMFAEPMELCPNPRPTAPADRELCSVPKESSLKLRGNLESKMVCKRKSQELFRYLGAEKKNEDEEHGHKRESPDRKQSMTTSRRPLPPYLPPHLAAMAISPPSTPVAPSTISAPKRVLPFVAGSDISTPTQSEPSSLTKPSATTIQDQPILAAQAVSVSSPLHSESRTPTPTSTTPMQAGTPRSRPQTTDEIARRFIFSAIGKRVPRRTEEEIKKQQEGMELRRKQREDRERSGGVQAWSTWKKAHSPAVK